VPAAAARSGQRGQAPRFRMRGKMGRLLKKKDPGKKTKKTQYGDDAGQDQNTPGLQAKPQAVVKKSYTPVSKATVVKEKNVIDKSIQFLREVKVELKKVTWPSRKQTMGSTVVVLVIVSIISIFLGVVDAGLSGLIRAVLQ
jgi:preprotein translocase subunit SecE